MKTWLCFRFGPFSREGHPSPRLCPCSTCPPTELHDMQNKQCCGAPATFAKGNNIYAPSPDPCKRLFLLAFESPPSAATSSRHETSLISPPAVSTVTFIGPVAPPAPTGGKETRFTCSLKKKKRKKRAEAGKQTKKKKKQMQHVEVNYPERKTGMSRVDGEVR